MINDPLLFRYLAGEASPEETSEIQNWLGERSQNEKHFESLKSIFNDKSGIPENSQQDEDWNRLLASMQSSDARNKKKPSRRLLNFSRVAAAVLILVLGTALIFKMNSENITVKGTSETPVATVLPDGSEVFLSKGAKVKYARNFDGEIRNISVSGDAFFRVTSDPDRPFIVQTGEAKIRVTGTSFMVSAPDKNDEVEVMVQSGKVLFYNSETFSENSFRVDLGPGDRGIYSSKLNQMNKTHDKEYKKLIWN